MRSVRHGGRSALLAGGLGRDVGVAPGPVRRSPDFTTLRQKPVRELMALTDTPSRYNV